MRWNASYDFALNARIYVNGKEVAATDADDKYGWADIDFQKSPGHFALVRIRIYGEVKIVPQETRQPSLTDEQWMQGYADQQELLRTCNIQQVPVYGSPREYNYPFSVILDNETIAKAKAIADFILEQSRENWQPPISDKPLLVNNLST